MDRKVYENEALKNRVSTIIRISWTVGKILTEESGA